jgi:Pyruvate/2-oxoacid:ferredoxin oxidoreductase gamma subunit
VGALSMHLDVDDQLFEAIIKERVPERFLNENMKAFAGGRAAGGK